MSSVCLLAVLSLAAPMVEVRQLDGSVVSGGLRECSPRGVVIETTAGLVTVAADKLLTLSPAVSTAKSSPGKDTTSLPTPSVWLELADGSSLPGSEYSVKGSDAAFKPLLGAALSIPLKQLRAVRLQPLNDAVAKKWSATLAARVGQDQLVIRRSDQVLDALEGVAKDVTAENVIFELDGEATPVKRGKVFGIVYYQPIGAAQPAALCHVHETGGGKLVARSAMLDGDRWTIVTVTGLELHRPWAAIERLDFSAGKFTYLSDLAPESVEWTPYLAVGGDLPELALLNQPRRDRAYLGSKLQLAQRDEQGQRTILEFERGLAIRSRTRLTYRLVDGVTSFTATAGIDPRVTDGGHVRLVIRGDDKPLLDATIARRDNPRQLKLNLTGAQRLTIVVDFGEELDIGDHLILGDARLAK